MHRLGLFLTLLSLALMIVMPTAASAQTTGTANPASTWCAYIDFFAHMRAVAGQSSWIEDNVRYNAYDGDIRIEGLGITNFAPYGDVYFSLTNLYTVQLTSAVIHVRTVSSEPTWIDVQSDMFGIPDSSYITIDPNVSSSAEILITPEYSEQVGQVLSMTFQSDSQVFIEGITITGTGAYPFTETSLYGDSPIQMDRDCVPGAPTPTPTPNGSATNTPLPSPTGIPSTATYTHTRTATNTPTSTQTYTPSATNTPTSNFCFFWPHPDPDINDGLHVWASANTVNYGDNPDWTFVAMPYQGNYGVTFTHVEFDVEWNGLSSVPDGIYLYVLESGATFSNPASWTLLESWDLASDHFEWDGSASVWGMIVDVAPTDDEDGTLVEVSNVQMEGVGIWEAYSLHAPYLCSALTATATATPTGTSSRTPSRTPIATRTQVSIGSPPPTHTPVATLPTSTLAPTIAPSATQTLVPFPTALPTTAPLDPEDEDYGEIQILNAIQDFFQRVGAFFTWVQNTVAQFGAWVTGTANWVTGTANNIGTLLSNAFLQIKEQIDAIAAILRDIGIIINLLIAIAHHLIDLALNYIDQMTNVIRFLVNDYQAAIPQPVPFLPQCETNPTGSSVCAVYYMLTYTIFSGTVGGLILPIFIVVVDILLMIYFAEGVRNLIRTVRSIFS